MGVFIDIIEERSLASAVADEIVACISDALEEKGRCSLVLSGGKTPGSIYRLLSRPPRVGEVDWSQVYLYWGDERWVAQDDLQSNYRMTVETLLNFIQSEKPKVHPVDTSLGSAEEGAKAYAATIREAEGLGPDQEPQFDIVLLGMGTDGHIASIFPDSQSSKDQSSKDKAKKDFCFATVQPGSNQSRVSLSKEVLFNASKVIFIVKGEHKAEILKRVLQEPVDPLQYPAASYKSASGSVSWFVDTAAAKLLDKDSLPG